MKWILAILLFVSGTAIGQSDDTDKYIWYKFQYGSRMPRFWADSILKAAGLVKFTGLAASVDTTAYKPIAVNSSGNVVKLPGWPGSGGATGPAGGDLTGTYPNPTITTNAVTDAKLAQMPGLSVKGNIGNTTDDVGNITAANDGNVLRRFGTSIGFGAINLASTNAVGSSILPILNGGTGTAFPSLVEGTNIDITGTWPNQTINSTSTTPSWQQTLNVGNTTSSTLFYDTTMVGSQVEKEWANYAPLVKTDTATNAFHQWQNSGANNGTQNEVMFWGWNVGPGGGQYIANRPAIGESWESNYQTNPDGFSDRLMEKHEIYVTPAGTQHRLSSYTINTNAGTINYYHTVGNFSLHNIGTHTPYYSILGTANNTQQTWINSSDQASYFTVNAEFNQDANTSALTINNGTPKPISLFNLSNFTSASFPSASFNGLGYDGAEISFYGATTGQLSKFLSDSSETRLANLTNVPINFVIDGTTSLAAYKTKAQTAVPLIVNNTNPASVPFAGVESLVSSASLEAGGWFRHSGTAASNKYGIEVSAIGANGTNEAIYINASNADNNRGIRIQFPSSGASNYAIYSDATAQSYFAGKIGMGNGVTSPDSTLQINGSFHNNAGVRMEGLPAGPGTKAVRIDANGTLSVADTSDLTPTSNLISHTLDARFTTQGNSGTSETDLYSYTVPANKLAADGRTVNFEIDGEVNDATATAQIKLHFAGNATLNTGAVNISSGSTAWRLKGYVMRTSSTTAHVTWELDALGLATPKFLGYSNLTSLDFTTTNIFKVTAQAGGAGGGTDDITAHSWQVVYKPQP